MHPLDAFAPQSQALALEPRILFDGAAASAFDQQHADAAHSAHVADTAAHAASAPDATARAATAVAPAAPATPAPIVNTLLVIDSRVAGIDQLTEQLPSNVKLLVVDTQTDGLAAISATLAQMAPVDSIQIISHGASGQFTLGDRTLTSSTVDAASATLAGWHAELSPGADIQLYGCDVGAGPAGQALVSELARLTGADVGASSDDTGNAAAGGNWTLEVRSGDVDKPIALSAAALNDFQGLLADAAPTVSLPTAGSDVLLGDQFSFTVDFANTSTQDGYAPYVDVFLPSTGKDGNDGVSFVAATYLGQPVQSFVLTFDAAGNATHPLAKDASGNPEVITAASVGMRPGDQMVVLELPYGSVSQDQPTIAVQVTASLSNLADTSLSNGAPDLTIAARGGFQFGNDALNDPSTDPTLVEATLHDFVVHPTLASIDQSIDMPEGETATGPNYGHTETVTITPAPGQTLHDVSVTQAVPDDVHVTSITPAGGGTLSSVSLGDGRVLTDPAQIAAALADSGTFVTSYTVAYATLSAPVNTLVGFYVPAADSSGRPVLDPATGAPVAISFAAPTATGRWTPVDPRDVTAPATDIDFSSTGDGAGASFTAKSITLQKQVTLQTDTGTVGLSPGDTLRYTLNLAVSDFFAFGENLLTQGSLSITDQLGDGQSLNGPATLSVTRAGITQTIALNVVSTPNADGTTTLVFDLAKSLQNAPGTLLGALVGDLAFDNVQSGATTAVISYGATIAQSYTTPHPPQPEINEGDSLSNTATTVGTILQDSVNLSGFSQSDGSSVTSTIPTSQVAISVATINGVAASPSAELRPGDIVTFDISYDLVTGDYQQFSLDAFLPQPLFDLSGIAWSQGTGVGQWSLGAGNTNLGAIQSVASGPGNSILFSFGDFASPATAGSRIDVQFTLRVGDQPFADQRSLDVLAQSAQVTTIDHTPLDSSDVAQIVSVAEPALSISHGVVSSSNGTVSGTSGVWSAPGSAGAAFQGIVTDPAAVNGDVSGIDAGDMLRLATTIENHGGGGAFDVQTSVDLPTGLSFVGGSLAAADLQVHRGDGTLLTAGVDYSVAGNQITFLDAGNAASLLPGRAGSAADASGANVVVITYDVTVGNTIAAASTLQTTATLTNYASVEGGTDFTTENPSDTAAEQVAAPTISKGFAGGALSDADSNAPQTTGSDLVIGESMIYDIVVTLPEGSTQNLRVDDLVPAGMQLDTTFNGGLGYQLITTVAGSGALGADFNGTVAAGAVSGIGGTAGDSGIGARLALSAASATADNNGADNSFVIRVRLITSDVIGNQAGVSLQNDAALTFTDPDSDTPNGAVAVDRSVATTGGRPVVTVREPTLTLTQATAPIPGLGIDQGSLVDYTVVIGNGVGSTDFNAYDISFVDDLPTQLGNYVLVGVTYAGGATNNGAPDFALIGQQLISVAGADIDIPRGGSITLHFTGVANATVASVPTVTNQASVQWTSLDGPNPNERNGTEGTLHSGVVDDSRDDSSLDVTVANGTLISRVGGVPQTPAPAPTDAPDETVTVGEIVRYRVVAVLAEGTADDYNLQVTLPSGLDFINDGSERIGFVSTNGLTSSVANLIVGGDLNALATVGNQDSPTVQPIQPDLSGVVPLGVLNPSQISVTRDANGNTVVVFSLGNLSNRDTDPDLEGVSLEFNAQVANQASNVAGTTLALSAVDRSGATELSTGRSVSETIVEPGFTGLNKQVVAFDPAPGATTGTATVAVSFTQNGSDPAFATQLNDSIAGGSGYVLTSLQLNGTTYTAANLPAGITVDTTSGLTVDFDQLNVGDQVRLTYQVTVANSAPIASSNAVLTWTSLPAGFTSWGGSSVGAAGGTSGERTGSGVGPNTYVLAEGAGLGVIQGTLWDDTGSATASATPDGPGLAGQSVTLTWAGLDGNLATAADNLTFSTVTDAAGHFQFGVLPAGIFRIDTPTGTISYPQPVGDLRVRIDSDAASPLGQMVVTLGEGVSATADAGYVEQNDPPQNHLPGTQNGLEDVPLPIAGLSISDADAGAGSLAVTLSVAHGTLSLSAVPTGVTVTGAGTATLGLSGDLASLNGALAALDYLGDANFNGADTLTIVTNDRGNTGDANGDGIPTQNPADALVATGTVPILLAPVNDAPTAVADAADAVEAGGTANGSPGVDPMGNLLANDSDVDIATNGDVLRVVSAATNGGAAVALPATGTTTIAGTYGVLEISATGGYQYLVDNANPVVQALRAAGQTLTDSFAYTLSDLAGLQSSSTLTITVHGADDAPVAVADNGTALEASGVNNATPGSDATGNLLANDSDVDAIANGESESVTRIRDAPALGSGAGVVVVAGTDSSDGTVIAGTYGTLTVGADGSYRFVVDNANPDVQRMVSGDTLLEVFSYQVTDAAGQSDIGQLNIVIRGANDNPVASDDAAIAQAASTNGDAQASNPSGNVILFPSRPGTVDQPGGNGVDTGVDRTDQPSSQLVVTGIRADTEADGGALTAVTGGTTSADGTSLVGSFALQNGVPVNGDFGTLHIGADGSYTFDVNSANAIIEALPAGQTIDVVYTYRITDPNGLGDQAQLVITVRGVNDPPLAQPLVLQATERGGVNNATPGIDPSGDATANAFDPDGDPLNVAFIRAGAVADGGAEQAVTAAGTTVAGLYGALTIHSDGTTSYALNNANATVQGLRTAGDLLFERFTYTIDDGNGETDQAEIIVVIHGQNDNPVANDDTATALEAGGVNNNLPGIDPTGNVLANDTDVDSAANGEKLAVSSVRTGTEAAATGTAGALGTELRGSYGWLTLNADGSYSYRLDNADPNVQALRSAADTLTDSFSYTVADAAGAEDRATLTVSIDGANDTPVALPARVIAVEAGGVANGTPGVNPTGNVLSLIGDVDGFGETLTVDAIEFQGVQGHVGTPLVSAYGRLVIDPDGQLTYLLDNDNPAVQALRTSGDTLTEVFTYRISDQSGATSSAPIVVTIEGSNDAPVANNDGAIAVEAGGTANATAGIDPVGNLLANDTDVDAGDGKTVTGIRTGTEAAGGAFAAVASSQTIAGQYGTLTLAPDGSYSYALNNALAAVQALRPGQTLADDFSYSMRDTAGATDQAELDITINGAWDAPVARDDAGLAVADNGSGNGVNPTGNVLGNDSDVDAGDRLHVSGVRLGTESVPGVLQGVNVGTDSSNGTLVQGQFGQLLLGADGSYVYNLDSANATVRALGPGQFLQETFTYQVSDLGGLSDLAEVHILIRGRNDAPIGRPDSAIAVEAGGLNNGSPGVDPSGNVLANDSDVDGDALHVSAIRGGSLASVGAVGSVGSTLQGLYGQLTMNADGSWHYAVDNDAPAVQALRTSTQTLSESFTYALSDPFGATSSAELRITIQGSNDTPVAHDDTATAVEAGGVANGTPGRDPSGNVLSNDTDVDSVANGETQRVVGVSNQAGQSVGAGQVLIGLYGQLSLNADGSYTYVLDNRNPAVEALRTAGDTLRDDFTYRMSDAAGATSQAQLHVLIQGADDAPVARDDSNTASGERPGPQATGNVLGNDSDVDAGDQLHVVGIRTGPEAGSGNVGTVGQSLIGRYGTLVLNADGSYSYTIDTTNPEVLAAAGMGSVLSDTFTYTVADRAGATDAAELVIRLDIPTGYYDPPPPTPYYSLYPVDTIAPEATLDLQPALYVTPEVERVDAVLRNWAQGSDGSQADLFLTPEIRSQSIGAGLGIVPGQFVGRAVGESRVESDLAQARILGRHGRVSLSADGLLSDPSVFAIDASHLVAQPASDARARDPQTAQGFKAQLQAAAERLHPLGPAGLPSGRPGQGR